MTQNRENGRRENNFNIVRFLGAIFVFAGHMGMILGIDPPLLAGFRLHEVGVMLLFLIGGYLVSLSWIYDSHPLRYAVRRFFRFWPPFAVMVLLTVFAAGPLLSDLGPAGYFQSWYTVYLKNLRFFIVFAQPGVFVDLPVAYTTNGSLWTMPVEALMYVLTPILVTVFRIKKRNSFSFRITAIFTGCLCIADLVLRFVFPDFHPVFYGTDWSSAFHLVVFYCMGILYTYDEMKKLLNLQAGGLAVCILMIFQLVAEPLRFVLFYIAFPYFMFSFALAPKPLFRRFGKKLELSYGIYLYGFLFQQIFTAWQMKSGVDLGYFGIFAVSFVPTVLAAVLSCVLIERPCIRLGRFLTDRLQKKSGVTGAAC